MPQCDATYKTATCGDVACTSLETKDNCGGCGASCNSAPVTLQASSWCVAPEGGAPECATPYTFSEANGDTLPSDETCANACVQRGFAGCVDDPVMSLFCAMTPTLSTGTLTLPCECSWTAR
jgi:hypothetical protein